jgi:hypothetical protein
MYDQNGLPKNYRLESQLSPKDIQTIQTAYRDAQYEADRHKDWQDAAGAEARNRMTTLKAIFGGAPFIDMDAEYRPCPFRKRNCTGFDCSLARVEKQARRITTGFDTECRWVGINMPCTECPTYKESMAK